MLTQRMLHNHIFHITDSVLGMMLILLARNNRGPIVSYTSTHVFLRGGLAHDDNVFCYWTTFGTF